MRTREIDLWVDKEFFDDKLPETCVREYIGFIDTGSFKAKLVIELPEIRKGFTKSEIVVLIDKLSAKFSRHDIDLILNNLFEEGE